MPFVALAILIANVVYVVMVTKAASEELRYCWQFDRMELWRWAFMILVPVASAITIGLLLMEL